MQCPQPKQPKWDSPFTVALLFSRVKSKSLQTATHCPHPVHFSWSILMFPFVVVLDVGIAMDLLSGIYCSLAVELARRF
jgi:hypothetical protein